MFRTTRALLVYASKAANKPKTSFCLLNSNRAISQPICRTFSSAVDPEINNQPTLDLYKESTVGDTPQEKKALWENYVQRIESNDPTLTAKDFMDISRVVLKDKTSGLTSRITRTQHILTQVHLRLDQEGFDQVFVVGCNILMNYYITLGDLKSARFVFKGLSQSQTKPSTTSILTIINGIGRHGTKGDLHQFIKQLGGLDLFPNDNQTIYIRLINEFRRLNDYNSCGFYFAEMSKRGLDSDEESYVNMFKVYRDSQQPDSAYRMFQYMMKKGVEPTVRSYGVLIPLLMQTSQTKIKAEKLFKQARASGIYLNTSIYLAMNWDPMESLEEMKRTNTEVTTRDYNTCLAAYVKQNKFAEALNVFDFMKREGALMDRYTYGIVIDVLSKDPKTPTDVVFDLYNEMKTRNVGFDAVIYTSLMTACTWSHHFDRALSLLEDMHFYKVKPNQHTFNAILGVLASRPEAFAPDLNRARLIWSKMTSLGIAPETRTFNLYLSIMSKQVEPARPVEQAQSGWSDEVLWENQDESSEYVSPTVKEILRTYRYMRRHEDESIRPDFVTYSIIINSLITAGQLRSAMRVYDDAKLKRAQLPITVYNGIMNALQDAGKISESMNIWHDMRLNSILPDSQTYEIVLENCEQLGLMDSLKSIRDQRKLDFDRLAALEKKREERLAKRKTPSLL
ncbi:hypothetical protein A0J61_00551 [Choanephora cucurbitarum]|uniref:PROP1-like PPR domain-containing protein n=1 Tax=Choanephora cucurbitarum TaxID=101091 RepID=A0A1C7NVB5_9FUNG|nr:hypothetical protein A0J61_00551 [Choanephora cucurbitarum]